MREAFGLIREIIAGLLQREAGNVWRKWNPVIWGIIKYRGCFGAPQSHCRHMAAVLPQIGFMRRLRMQYRNRARPSGPAHYRVQGLSASEPATFAQAWRRRSSMPGRPVRR